MKTLQANLSEEQLTNILLIAETGVFYSDIERVVSVYDQSDKYYKFFINGVTFTIEQDYYGDCCNIFREREDQKGNFDDTHIKTLDGFNSLRKAKNQLIDIINAELLELLVALDQVEESFKQYYSELKEFRDTVKIETTPVKEETKETTKMTYIQRKDNNYLETVDGFNTRKEAIQMLKEYRMSDNTAYFYLSNRPCKNWNN